MKAYLPPPKATMSNLNVKFLYYLPPLLFFSMLAVETGFLEQALQLTRPQSIALVILILAGLLWVFEWIPLYLTSFVILLFQLIWLVPALEAEGHGVKGAKFLSPFFSSVVLLFLGGFVLAAALHRYALDKRIAHWLLEKTGNRPPTVMLGFMLTSAFLSMWMSNTATTAMMFAIMLPLLDKIPPGHPFAKGLALSIPFACNLGGLGTPIGTPPNAIALSYLAEKGIQISFSQWMLASLPLMFILLFLMWRLLLLIYPTQGLILEFPESDSTPLSLEQKLVAAIFLFTVIAWFFAGYIGVSVGTLSLIPIILLFGLGLLKSSDFKQLSWDVLFMVGGGICLGVGLAESGLTQHIVNLLPGGDNFAVILIGFGLLASVMTTFMSNTATANLLIPLAISLPQEVQIVVLLIALNCSTSMALPISTPPNAIAFGSGLLEAKDMIRPGVVISILSLILTLSVGGYYWSHFIF